jgi:hypothetical protein
MNEDLGLQAIVVMNPWVSIYIKNTVLATMH